MSTLNVVKCILELGSNMFSSIDELDQMILDENDADKQLISSSNYPKYIEEKVEIGRYISSLIIQNIADNVEQTVETEPQICTDSYII